METKRVYLVRHGETTYNKKGLVQDHSSELTDQGKRQAIAVAERAQQLSFRHLLVSDYLRTRQTAEPILAVTDCQPEYSPLFREVRRPSEFFHQDRNAEPYQTFLAVEMEHFSEETWRHSDEENFSDLKERALAALDYLTQKDGDVLVVSHGHFIRFLVAMTLTGESFSGAIWRQIGYRMQASNTGITTLTYDQSGWKLLTFNDIAHFAE